MNNGDRYFIDYVEPGKLFESQSQPESRSTSSLKKLIASIESVGLQYPPLVTRKPDGKGFTIIDGHRRIAAWKCLYGEREPTEKIPVMVAQGTPSELFTAVTGTIKPMTTMQWLEVHLKHGLLPSGRTKSNIQMLEKTMGPPFLQKLLASGVSPSIWIVAGQVINYLDLDEGTKRDIIHWILENRLSREVGEWVKSKLPKPELKSAFEQRRRPQILGSAADLVQTKA